MISTQLSSTYGRGQYGQVPSWRGKSKKEIGRAVQPPPSLPSAPAGCSRRLLLTNLNPSAAPFSPIFAQADITWSHQMASLRKIKGHFLHVNTFLLLYIIIITTDSLHYACGQSINKYGGIDLQVKLLMLLPAGLFLETCHAYFTPEGLSD